MERSGGPSARQCHIYWIFIALMKRLLFRLKDKYYEEQKRVCQTMDWKDYNQRNLLAYDGDLGGFDASNHSGTG